MTASAFGEHAAFPAVRMYRTGDRVRRLPGGGLEFLDRNPTTKSSCTGIGSISTNTGMR